MKNNELNNDVYEVSKEWLDLSNLDKELKIKNFLKEFRFDNILKFSTLSNDGQINFCLLQELKADERCNILLDIEGKIKDNIDKGLTLWLEPMGDKNTLRNLRGIKVVE